MDINLSGMNGIAVVIRTGLSRKRTHLTSLGQRHLLKQIYDNTVDKVIIDLARTLFHRVGQCPIFVGIFVVMISIIAWEATGVR